MDTTSTLPASALRTLDQLPGPRPWPLLGNALQVRPARFHLQLEKWAQRYGEACTFSTGAPLPVEQRARGRGHLAAPPPRGVPPLRPEGAG